MLFMRRNKMTLIGNRNRTKNRFSLLLVGMCLICLTPGCRFSNDNSDAQDSDYKSAITFSLSFDGIPNNKHTALAPANIDICQFHGIESIGATVYNDSDESLTSSTWPCSDHQGTIYNVPVGSNYRVVVEGWTTGDDESSWRGQAADVTVLENTETDLGEVSLAYTDALDAPTQVDAAPGDESALMSWHGVREAAAYNIYWSTSPDISLSNYEGIISDEENTSTYIEDLTNTTTYYLMVTSNNEYSESVGSIRVIVTPDKITRNLETIDLQPPSGSDSNFGWTVGSGDFNGDGLQDVAAADDGYDNPNPQANRGAVFVNYGDPNFDTAPGAVIASPDSTTGSTFGFYVSGVGDTNGDGFDDLLVAMGWGFNNAYLFYGSDQGLSAGSVSALLPPDNYEAYGFGHSISGGGDINNDGYDDFVIATGGAFGCVYYGSDSGASSKPQKVLSIGNGTSGSAMECSIIGDINQDGYDDVALNNRYGSATYHTDVFIYHGSATGINTPNQTIAIYVNEEKEYGFSVAIAGAADFSADGHNDIIIGNQWATNTNLNEGEGRLYFGSSLGLSDTAIILNNPRQANNSRFGDSVDGIGDFNYDGIDDVIIGCPYDNFATVYFGQANPTSDLSDLTIDGATYFGWSVSKVGDIIGNGENFIAVGEEFGAVSLFAYSNAKPIANAGSDIVISGDLICQLDGRQSSDADNDLLSYQWTITSSPSGSNPALSDATIPTPTLYMDIPGTYTLDLEVDDGFVKSDPAAIEITRS